MEYKLSEQELQDLMHRSWLKAKNFYKGQTDEYFYDFFESEKKQLTIHSVVVPKGTLFCGKENKTCEYLKSDNKCGLRKRWCTYQAK